MRPEVAQLAVDRRAAVAVCTITGPPQGYLDSETVAELDAVTRELEGDDSIRAVVFAGGLSGVFIRHH